MTSVLASCHNFSLFELLVDLHSHICRENRTFHFVNKFKQKFFVTNLDLSLTLSLFRFSRSFLVLAFVVISEVLAEVQGDDVESSVLGVEVLDDGAQLVLRILSFALTVRDQEDSSFVLARAAVGVQQVHSHDQTVHKIASCALRQRIFLTFNLFKTSECI